MGWWRGSGCRGVWLFAMALLLSGCWSRSPDLLVESARKHLERADPTSAILDLKSALQEKPAFGEARLLLGKALLANQDPAGAEAELQRALALGVPPQRVATSLAQAWLELGKPQQVIDQFQTLQPGDDREAAALRVEVARALLQTGDVERARAEVAEGLRRLSQHVPSRILAARMKATGGETAAALADAEALIAEQPGDPQVWMLQADLLGLTRAPVDQAEKAYRKAIELRPDLLAAHAAVVALRIAQGDVPGAEKQVQEMLKVARGDLQAKYLEASVALLAGRPGQTRVLTQALLRVAPQHPKVLFLAGLAEMLLGATALAETLLSKAVVESGDAAEPRHALGEVRLRLGKPAEALDVLAPLTREGTTDARAVALAAQAHLMNGDARRADEWFARASMLAPADTGLRTARVLSQFGRGRDELAIAELAALAKADNEPTADFALISAMARRGDLKGAMAAVDALAAKLPQQPLPDLLRGQIAQQMKDPQAARHHYESALKKDSRFLPALRSLVAMDIADGKPELARGRLTKQVEKHPDHAPGILMLVEFLRRTGAPREETEKWLQQAARVSPADVDVRIAIVDHHLRGSDARTALQAAQVAVSAARENADLLERLGAAQLRAGEVNQAIVTFTKLVSLRQGAPAAHLQLAMAYEAAGQNKAAQRQIAEAIKAAPDAVPPRQAAVMLAIRSKEWTRAADWARSLQKQYPEQAVGYALEGEVRAAQQQWPEAAAAFRDAVKRQQPGDAPARLHFALLQDGKTDEAAGFERSWLRTHPGDTVFMLRLADAAMSRGDHAGAEARYRTVLETKPEDPWALNNLALVLLKQGKPGALELAERAVAAAPARADVRDTLALAQASGNDIKKALATQLEAVALAPENGPIRLHLAKLYLRSGDRDRARSELSRLTRLGPAFSGHAEVEQLLKQVGPGPVVDTSAGRRSEPSGASRFTVSATLGAIAGGVVALGLALVLLVAALRPPVFRVERSIVVDAPAQRVFDLLHDLRRWEDWSVLRPFGPAATRSFTGVVSGRATICNWRDSRRGGEGSLQVMHSVAPASLVIELAAAPSNANRHWYEFTLAPTTAGSTDVHWVSQDPATYARRLVDMVSGLDRRTGKELEANLARLKAAAEAAPLQQNGAAGATAEA
jgi:putative PEP-CTERM system TPR-repeat lipoprotein